MDKHPFNELDTINQKHLQKFAVKFLYCAQANYSTMLMALNYLAAFQTKPTIEIAKHITHFLNNFTSHLDAVMEYIISDIILYIYSDSYQQSEPEARNRSGRYFFLGPWQKKTISAMPQAN